MFGGMAGFDIYIAELANKSKKSHSKIGGAFGKPESLKNSVSEESTYLGGS